MTYFPRSDPHGLYSHTMHRFKAGDRDGKYCDRFWIQNSRLRGSAYGDRQLSNSPS